MDKKPVSQNYKDLAKAIGCSHKSVKTIANYKKEAIEVLGIKAKHRDIVAWLYKNITVTKRGRKKAANSTDEPKTRNRKKVERKNDLKLIRISFNGKQARQHITIESEFKQALDFIAPNAVNTWLAQTVDNYIECNGAESITRIIKCEIVKVLLEKASQSTSDVKQKSKNTKKNVKLVCADTDSI